MSDLEGWGLLRLYHGRHVRHLPVSPANCDNVPILALDLRGHGIWRRLSKLELLAERLDL